MFDEYATNFKYLVVQKINYILMNKKHNTVVSAAHIDILSLLYKAANKCNYMNSTIVAFALAVSIFSILLTGSSTDAQLSGATMNKVTIAGILKLILQQFPLQSQKVNKRISK